MPRIGIIGGSGLYQMQGLTDREEIRMATPFGDPSDAFLYGRMEGREIIFLPRHGRGHRILPTELNHRANIWAMKKLGVEQIISVSAVGSFKPQLRPLDIVVIDQYVDRTNAGRPATFFGQGIVAHVGFAQPMCEELRKTLFAAGQENNAPIKWGGTYINIEGPAFSTLAESRLMQSWGMDVVGMTQMNEARLAREAEICYATLALVTDYDCWWEAETGHTVSVELVVENLNKNIETAKAIIRTALRRLPEKPTCACSSALANAIMTDRKLWPDATTQKLEPILRKYL